MIGTAGVLETAAIRGLIDLPSVLTQLQADDLLCVATFV